MTDTPTPPIPVADQPDPDDEPLPEGVKTVGAGWLYITIEGTEYRLRRPFVGELRKLREALEHVQDLIDTGSIEAEDIAAEVERELKAAADLSSEDQTELRSAHRELRRRAKAAARKLVNVADDARLEWWQLVFETLSVSDPQMPDDWPSWVVDINLPGRVTNHWRTDPLAPGR